MTPDLASWLLEQLDTDAEQAEALDGARWEAATYVGDHYNVGVVVPAGGSEHDQIITCGVEHLEDGELQARHIARWDPARVLAEVEAKRRIVDAYRAERRRRDAYQAPSARDVETTEQTTQRRCSAARCRGLEIAAELLALPYADRPGYLSEWRP